MGYEGKVAIITGSGQGIGRVYAHRLAEGGAKVVIADVNEKKALQVAEEIKESGKEALGIGVDVANHHQIEEMTRTVASIYGRIDILINNAAIFSTLKPTPFDQISDEEWDRVFEVNMKGMFLCCKAVVPYMKKQRSGRIINISSGAALEGGGTYLHYTSSKAAVLGFTKGLARELGEYNITVNALCPGLTITEVPRATLTEEQKSDLLRRQCIKRTGKPEDLAGVVSFLCTDEASFISGQCISVDGGVIMR